VNAINIRFLLPESILTLKIKICLFFSYLYTKLWDPKIKKNLGQKTKKFVPEAYGDEIGTVSLWVDFNPLKLTFLWFFLAKLYVVII